MIGFFLPKYVREGREMLKGARKMLHYKRDILRPQDVELLEKQMATMKVALQERNATAVAEASKELDASFGRLIPQHQGGFLRENCEVFLVAIVVALGVRTYFLQPFTIPTGSMQPTLNGIIGYPTVEPPPMLPVRLLHLALYGRTYVDAVSKEDDIVRELREVKKFGFFTFTQIQCERQRFVVHAPLRQLVEDFGVTSGRPLYAGEVVARGYVNTGDHVFVDKVSYNFQKPKRGEVFVFNTLGIPTNENRNNPNANSQFYIKRLVGLPGDELQIVPPDLFINGHLATEPMIRRVMSCEDGYRGYSNTSGGRPFRYLGEPNMILTVLPKSYFALGDNSYHSSDSRDWGFVPEKNVVGRGFFVYWPFTSHWGFIK